MRVLASGNYNNFMCPFFTKRFIEQEMEIEAGDRKNYYSLFLVNFHILFKLWTKQQRTNFMWTTAPVYVKKLKC